jgi:hypothetical protein
MKSGTAIYFASAALAAGLVAMSPAAEAQDAGIPPAPTEVRTCSSTGGLLIPCVAHPGAAYGVPYSGNANSSGNGLLGALGAIVTTPTTMVAGTTEPLVTGRSVAVSGSIQSESVPPAPTEVRSCASTGGVLLPCIAHPGSAYGTPRGNANSSDSGFLGGIGAGLGSIITAPATIMSSATPK